MSFLKELDHLRIPLRDIKTATNNFAYENAIGPGGYGMVYKGKLLYSGQLVTVAAKRVDRGSSSAANEFLNEMRVLCHYKHVNIVPLIGFCDEHKEKVVVQEYMPNRSLDSCLSSAKLTWLKRLEICLGAAHGLSYLHNGLEGHTVLHRDVRSRTILLDKNWQAKIGGFGLSNMHSKMNQRYPKMYVDGGIGAPGYADPSYLRTGIVTGESDVYSFGVVLFEVLCGTPAYETNRDNVFLGPVARVHYEDGKLNDIIDPILREQMNQDSLEAFSAIAYQCLKNNPSERPTMIEIVDKLEHVLGLQYEFEKALALQQVALDLKRNEDDEDNSYKVKNLEHMKIPLKQIKLATNDFHDDFKIGQGGYGKVYKAELFHFDAQKYVRDYMFQRVSMDKLLGYPRRRSKVAVKRLDRRYGQGTTEFLQEISVLPNFRHQNLITLVGYCDEEQERILVYEYASNGSLDEYISSTNRNNNHSWALRLQICLDAARGLEFLHNGVGEHYRIIHRDVKSSNILLCQNLEAKISDFGLSRIGPANLQATFVLTQVAGTLEYVDPQYHKTGILTKGSDVYSFGVVLFEVLSGRLAYFQKSKNDQEFLPHMAKRCFEQNNVKEIIDPSLKKEFEIGSSTISDESFPDSVSIFAEIAYKCLQENRDDRPSMTEVVKGLEKALNSQIKGVEALRTSLDTIRFATNDFSDAMENEVYGKVYSGQLSHSKGQSSIIVKRFDHIVGSYGTNFYKEIALLYSYSHKNIIPVLGFCEEASERIIVFENMVNGSLKEHLKNSSLKWKKRVKICVDAARGLAYIHNCVDTQHLVHGDVKSSSVLLNQEWEAVISNFIISKGLGTLGYYDPVYEITGILTQKSDVYSFGVLLFEVLSGRLAVEKIKQDLQGDDEGQLIFLSQLASQCGRIEDIIFHDIKGQIGTESLIIFSTIAYQCLQELPENRPTMDEVVKELERALESQEEWEWEQKLPLDYQKIVDMAKYPISNTSSKKDLYSLLSSGILLHKEKLWFSISMDGKKNEMVPATRFSYKNVKWRSISNSRFSKVAKISDISDLNIRIHTKPQFLTPDIMYGAYLVFKFCDRRKFSSRPVYVNLKYNKAGESLNAYFARWRAGSKWLRVELFRFWNNKETIDFDVLLKSFSRYYCGNGGIFIEGIEFNAIDHSLESEEKDEKNKRGVLKRESDIEWPEQMALDCYNIIKRSEKNKRGVFKRESDIEWVEQMAIDCYHIIKRSEINENISKEELYLLLYNGILIDKGKKIFFVSKVNKKICHMLPAKAVIINDHPNKTSYNIKTDQENTFVEYIEILRRHEIHIKCDIEKQLLSSETTYACFLVFKLSERCRGLKCPVKARDLLPYRKERTKIISFTSPTTVNLDDIKWVAKQRADGWMEVIVCEIMYNNKDINRNRYIPMDLKLICFQGTMCGLVICGIEFRPML